MTFFKNLNRHDNDQEPFNTECHESLNEINEEINQQISNEEILKATKKLKNNKKSWALLHKPSLKLSYH